MTAQTVTIPIPSERWLSSNQRIHRMDAAGRTRDIRLIAKHYARELEPMDAAIITVAVGYPTAREADAPNSWPSAKAAIDGLVDAGILPDDSTRYVPEHRFTRHPDKTPRGQYALTITLEPLP